MSNKLLSIIIVSYNNIVVIKNCIDSILKYNDIGDSLQIIVVEQSTSDTIYSFICNNYPQVEIYKTDNRGFGAGNNVGEKHAAAPYLLFLNPDTVLISPIACYSIKKFESNSRLGLFGLRLLDSNHKKTYGFENIVPYGLLPKIIIRFSALIERYNASKMYIQGADLFVRKDVFEKIGGFDENIFMYGEEADLCTRVRNHDYLIEYFKDNEIVHLQGKCSVDEYKEKYKRQVTSFIYYCNKYGMDYYKHLSRELKYLECKIRLYRIKKVHNKEEYSQIIDKISVLLEHVEPMKAKRTTMHV